MHDLEIAYSDRPHAAVEVTAAADAESIELWNLVNGGGRWVEPNLIGGWSVELLPHARARRLHAELPTLLRQLEEQGIREVGDGPEHRGGFDAAANSLGITSLLQLDTAYPGSIYPTIALSAEKSGGAVAQTGDALASWLGDWIAQSEQAHNLDKVVSSGAGERHMFLILPGFAEAPFGVVDLLMRDEAPLPTIPPTLPPEVTHVWAVSTWSTGDGMRFSPDMGWQRFDKRVNQGASGGKDATAGRSWS